MYCTLHTFVTLPVSPFLMSSQFSQHTTYIPGHILSLTYREYSSAEGNWSCVLNKEEGTRQIMKNKNNNNKVIPIIYINSIHVHVIQVYMYM